MVILYESTVSGLEDEYVQPAYLGLIELVVLKIVSGAGFGPGRLDVQQLGREHQLLTFFNLNSEWFLITRAKEPCGHNGQYYK
jgi:hypothetical protein